VAVNGISDIINTNLRLVGLSSGLDTDTIIKQLMSVESAKLDKVKQEKQLLEWKRDAYRDVINMLKSFTSEYFDILKPSTNFTSSTAFASFKIKSANESVVSVKAGVGAASTSHTITVSQLASAAKIEGVSGLADYIKGSGTVSDLSLKGKQIVVTLDGVEKKIALDDYSSMEDLETKLEQALSKAFGSGKIDVVVTDNKVEFKTLINGSTFSISDASNNFISTLGLGNGQKNYITGANVNTDYSVYTNGSFKITVGSGSEQIISIDGATDIDDLTNKIQAAIDSNAELSGKIRVTNNGSKLNFITLSGETIKLTSGDTNNVLDKLGFANGASVSAMSSAIDLSGDEKGQTFIVNVNGEDKIIEIDQDYSDLDALAAYIEGQLGGTVNVSKDPNANRLIFSTTGEDMLSFKKGPDDGLEKLGFSAQDNRSNKVSLTAKLDSIKDAFKFDLNIADPGANVVFTINGETIDVGKTYANATLNDVMDAINKSNAGVKISYDSLRDRFVMESKTLGATSSIEITDTDPANGLLRAMGLVDGTYTEGKDAEFSLDGVTGMKRSSNEFTIDGVTYTLKGISTEPVTVEVESDIDAVVEKIKGFVSKYNEVLDKINGLLTEKRYRDYLPLTDAQKDEMKDKDIEKWEEKAKSGLLRSDSILQDIVSSMRAALYEKVEGTSLSLFDIGITTGAYTDKGKLTIDETKLRAALTDNFEEVVRLFTNKSQYSYTEALGDSEKRKIRYSQSGLAQRLSDILQDNIRTTRDSKGQKGRLLEKAGISGDLTEFKNLITNEINAKDSLIDTLIEKLYKKEEYYYSKFTAMEKMLSRMQSQSAWFIQQMGG
jgi:flagellar hook-associated protein 2